MTTSCPNCQAPVSPKAYDCPGCGHPLRKLRRGPFGVLVKWVFILFNVLMIAWIISGMNAVAPDLEQGSELDRSATAAGAGIAIYFILTLWVMGDVILGLLVLFTRPRK